MKYFWDASALVKRYCSEKGTEQVNYLFQAVSLEQFIISEITLLEVVSIFTRKKNERRISQDQYELAIIEFGKEIASSSMVGKSSFNVQPIVNTTQLLVKHGLNSVDAVLLRTAMNHEKPIAIITTDLRLAQAATIENLIVINPELVQLHELTMKMQGTP